MGAASLLIGRWLLKADSEQQVEPSEIEFKEDSTFEYTIPGHPTQQLLATYTLNGNVIALAQVGASKSREIPFSMPGDGSLHLRIDNQNLVYMRLPSVLSGTAILQRCVTKVSALLANGLRRSR